MIKNQIENVATLQQIVMYLCILFTALNRLPKDQRARLKNLTKGKFWSVNQMNAFSELFRLNHYDFDFLFRVINALPMTQDDSGLASDQLYYLDQSVNPTYIEPIFCINRRNEARGFLTQFIGYTHDFGEDEANQLMYVMSRFSVGDTTPQDVFQVFKNAVFKASEPPELGEDVQYRDLIMLEWEKNKHWKENRQWFKRTEAGFRAVYRHFDAEFFNDLSPDEKSLIYFQPEHQVEIPQGIYTQETVASWFEFNADANPKLTSTGKDFMNTHTKDDIFQPCDSYDWANTHYTLTRSVEPVQADELHQMIISQPVILTFMMRDFPHHFYGFKRNSEIDSCKADQTVDIIETIRLNRQGTMSRAEYFEEMAQDFSQMPFMGANWCRPDTIV